MKFSLNFFAKFLFCLTLFYSFGKASSLLTYNFYSKDEYFDIVLGFDEPYAGGIGKQETEGKTTLILNELNIKEETNQALNSKIIKQISIANLANNSLQIELFSQNELNITAAKSNDKFSMRIRIASKNPPNFADLGAQKENNLDSKYITVIIFLSILCAILFFIKRKILQKKAKLNKSNATASQEKSDFSSIISAFSPEEKQSIDILFEKNLDEKNRVILLKHNEKKYLVLVGSSNVMLDKFGEDNIYNQSDFEAFFEQNKEKLANYITNRQSSLENYKNTLSQD